jgi:FXSXX-COOH protein
MDLDLGGIGLLILDRLPSAVLRDAINRVRGELDRQGEAAAFFQSGLRRPE